MTAPRTEPLSPDLLDELEACALGLAREAGEQIVDALAREVRVEYKGEPRGAGRGANPVSEVDHAVEQLVRERVGSTYPDHGVIGEEVDHYVDASVDFVWVIDPVDGTGNFVNGFPLFSASIGLLHRGRPVAGAIWCSTGHALRPGVYHAREGGPLRFEGEPLHEWQANPGVTRHLAAGPGGWRAAFGQWDTRVTGSTATECAFVAAGILQGGVFGRPAIWDVAAGVCLIHAAGLTVLTRHGRQWRPFEVFEPPQSVREDRAPSLRDWRAPLLVGTAEATTELARLVGYPSLWRRLRLRLRGLR